MEERQQINFDHPDAFEWKLLIRHLQELKEGHAVEQPIYDYVTSSRMKDTVHVEPSEIIIIEGIMVLHHPKLREQMDLKVFVDADADDRLIRVIRRDIVERGRTTEAVIERYQRVLKPMHEQFIEPCKRYANVIIPQGGHNNAAINMMAKFIKQQIRDK
jgi:uridine kinase